MHHLNPAKTALAVGKLFAVIHIVWALFIALGWAKSILTFSMWAHMVSAPVVIKAFDLSAAITLVVVAAVVGGVVGYAFAKIWNWVHKS